MVGKEVLAPKSAFEIPTVSEKIYAETHRAVEATGAFITSIRSVSIEDLLKEDGNRTFWQSRFNPYWVSRSKTMRAIVPPAMEVFITTKVEYIYGSRYYTTYKTVRIEESNRHSIDEQKAMIAEAEARFKDQLPEEVRPFVSLHMADPSTYSQLEDAWVDAGYRFLFPDYFACTNVQTVEGDVAGVGRYYPEDKRSVDIWSPHSRGLVFAVPVGVLPRKLAV